jgi:hypothetical protein
MVATHLLETSSKKRLLSQTKVLILSLIGGEKVFKQTKAGVWVPKRIAETTTRPQWFRAQLRASAGSLIAICALSVAVHSAYQTRRYARLAVRPHFTIYIEGPAAYLQNAGAGPLSLRWFRISVDGSPVQSWVDVFSSRTFAVQQI